MSKKRRGNPECVESQLEEAEGRQEESGPVGCGKRRENDVRIVIGNVISSALSLKTRRLVFCTRTK